MNPEKVNVYEACDRAIKAMNRENVELFGQLKGKNFDELNIIQTVTQTYTKSLKSARKKYFEVAFEAYILGLMMCDVEPKKAHQMAEKAITMRWVDEVLNKTDFITLYRFYTEAERKAYKLAETLEVSPNRAREIDKALRYWSQQLGQYAINITDAAILQAFTDMGVEMVQWISEHDMKTCRECMAYDGQVFRIRELPPKPHWGCRCRYRPIFRQDDGLQVEAAET